MIRPLVTVALGMMMAGLIALQGGSASRLVVAGAAIAVLLGVRWLLFVVPAVLLTMAGVLVSDVSALVAASAGLCGCVYLLLRCSRPRGVAVETLTVPSAVLAVAFAAVGVLATAGPAEPVWLPLLAPVTAIGLYALAVGGFRRNDRRTDPMASGVRSP